MTYFPLRKIEGQYTFATRKAFARVDTYRPIGQRDLWVTNSLIIELQLRIAINLI